MKNTAIIILLCSITIFGCNQSSPITDDTALAFIRNTDFKTFAGKFPSRQLPYKLRSYNDSAYTEAIVSNDTLPVISSKDVSRFLETIEVKSVNGASYSQMLSYFAASGDTGQHRFYCLHRPVSDTSFIGLVFMYVMRTDAGEQVTGGVFATFDKFGNAISAILLSYQYLADNDLQTRMFTDASIDNQNIIKVLTTTASNRRGESINKNDVIKMEEQYVIKPNGTIEKIGGVNL